MSDLSDLPDLELLHRYRNAGCAEAFRALVERHAGMVCATAGRLLGNDLWAQDVMQAVFVDLARKGRALPESIVPGAWLYRSACRHALNRSRSEQRRQRRDAAHLAMSEVQSPEEAWQAIVPHVDEALLSLRGADRTALVLRFLENQPLREVGQALGVSEDTAQKRVSRALTKLRSRLLRRGVKISAAMLGGAALRESVKAATPSVPSGTVAGVALSEGSPASLWMVLNCHARTAFAAAGVSSLLCAFIWKQAEVKERPGVLSAEPRHSAKGGRAQTGTGNVPAGGSQFPALIPPATAEEALAMMLRLDAQPDNYFTGLQKSWLASSEVLSPLSAARLAELLEACGNERVQYCYAPQVIILLSRSDPGEATRWSLRFRADMSSLAASSFTSWADRDTPAAFQWLFSEGLSASRLAAPPPQRPGQIRTQRDNEARWLPLVIKAVSEPLRGIEADFATAAARLALIPEAYRPVVLAADFDPGVISNSPAGMDKLRAYFAAVAGISDPGIRAALDRSIVNAYLKTQPDVREAQAQLASVYPGGMEALNPLPFIAGRRRRGQVFRPEAAQAALDSVPPEAKPERMKEIAKEVLGKGGGSGVAVPAMETWLAALPQDTPSLDAARAELFKQTLQARGGFIQTVFHKELPVQDAAMHDRLICGWAQRMAGREDREILQVLLEEGRAAKSWSPTLRARVAEILSLKPVAGE